MKNIRRLFNRLFTKTEWKSNILTIHGTTHEISRGYEGLVNTPNVKITGGSVTRSSHAIHKEHGNDCTYLMVIFYDYCEQKFERGKTEYRKQQNEAFRSIRSNGKSNNR